MENRTPERSSASMMGGTALLAWLVLLVGLGALLQMNAMDVMLIRTRTLYGLISFLLVSAAVLGFILLWRLELAVDGSSRTAVVFRVLVALGATLGLLFSVEALARVFPVFDSFALNPGARYMWPEFFLPKSSLGYKDREPGQKRGPRILVLGDSYAEGAGVRRSDRFSNVLEQLYRADSDPDLEVYNAGRCGMDTLDEARMLAATGDQISPDVVVVAYALNDADGVGLRPTGAQPSWLRRLFLKRLRSYFFYRLHSRSRRVFLPTDRDPFLKQHQVDSPGWQLVVRSFDQIAAWARERSIPAVLVALPIFAEYGERHRPILDQVVAAALASGLRARNCIDDYEGRLAELAVSSYDAHPGREAHFVTAVALRRFVGRPWAGEPQRQD